MHIISMTLYNLINSQVYVFLYMKTEKKYSLKSISYCLIWSSDPHFRFIISCGCLQLSLILLPCIIIINTLSRRCRSWTGILPLKKLSPSVCSRHFWRCRHCRTFGRHWLLGSTWKTTSLQTGRSGIKPRFGLIHGPLFDHACSSSLSQGQHSRQSEGRLLIGLEETLLQSIPQLLTFWVTHHGGNSQTRGHGRWIARGRRRWGIVALFRCWK